MNQALFGPAGNSQSFHDQKGKTYQDIVDYVVSMGLDAYEYQCGRGVRISTEAAGGFGLAAKAAGIQLSLHAPYYISLSSLEEEKREGSIRYILQSAKAVTDMGGRRIIIHSGSCGKLSRIDALELAKDTLRKARQALDEAGYEQVIMCPETMGKVNQLGNLEEVLELCKLDERNIPCIDFGHLNARTFGWLDREERFAQVLSAVENALGYDRLKVFHSHFSKIEYTPVGGEKVHLTFADETFGPRFENLVELLVKKSLTPTIICESAGTQAEDARTMKELYLTKKGN